MDKLIQIALEDVAECFGIEEDLYQKYYRDEVLQNEELTKLIESRNNFGDWRKKTPLGGPGTVLNAVVLYCLIKHYYLPLVLETGVSGGFYSAFMLAALEGLDPFKGILQSLEIEKNEEVGKLVPEKLKQRWRLHDGKDSLEWLRNRKDEHVNYGHELYCHDSLHTMSHMMQELLEFKKCRMKRFFIYIDDQDADLFWHKCIQMGTFKKPGYDVQYISGNESRLKGHLGGFLKYDRR